MAKRRGTAVLKRQREVRKAEKMAAKKEKKQMRREDEVSQDVATAEDLEGYGFVPPADEDDDRETGV